MIYQRVIDSIAALSVTLMIALSPSYSMANTSANKISVDHLAWKKMPAAVQKYYQPNSKLNKLKLNTKDIVAIRSWIDVTGTNYLVQLQRFNEDATSDSPAGEVISHLYHLDENKAQRVWQIYDYVSCDLDVIANYAKDSAVITDIDNNGIAEVSVPYYIGCRGGVDYDEMKIIMYESARKFAIRGNSAICDSNTGLPVKPNGYGGEYKIDEKLLQQSKLSEHQKIIFRRHLKSVWRENQCSIYFEYND